MSQDDYLILCNTVTHTVTGKKLGTLVHNESLSLYRGHSGLVTCSHAHALFVQVHKVAVLSQTFLFQAKFSLEKCKDVIEWQKGQSCLAVPVIIRWVKLLDLFVFFRGQFNMLQAVVY